jgi:CheY-like chemotaxis protein
VSEIVAAGNRAKDLTRQLLAFSRKQVLDVKTLNVNDAVRGFEKMIKRLIGEDVQIRVLTRENVENVNADLSQLEQVILNLCVNARDAMPEGGTLTIETGNVWLDEHYAAAHPDTTPGPYVMMSVSDSGCGMDEETQRQIFEPFFTTKDKGKGTGLGLATVFGIVKQHGGNIWVYSEVGCGSTFKVYLPAVRDEKTGAVSEQPETVMIGSGETILVVEDEDAVRRLTIQILRRLEYDVIEARSGEECLGIARSSQHIDLLLSDVIMPGMNGRQLYERVAELRPGIHALFMSGYTENIIAHHGILEEGIQFIPKPFTEVALSRKIHNVLNNVSAE